MKRFVEGEDPKQAVLLPEYLEDYVSEDNPVRVVDVFVDELDLHDLGFDGTAPAATGRPPYHPSVLLKIYIYGYLNRIQSSRRLERETQRNIELMWLTGRLSPDFKTIADFRRSNGKAIRNVCSQFIVLCRNLDLFSKSIMAIDGSKFKAVNNRDRNFTPSDRRAPVWHAEILDGSSTLPYENTRACQHRDEPSCPRIQPQARHGDPRRGGDDAKDASVRIGSHHGGRAGAHYGAWAPLPLTKRSKRQ